MEKFFLVNVHNIRGEHVMTLGYKQEHDAIDAVSIMSDSETRIKIADECGHTLSMNSQYFGMAVYVDPEKDAEMGRYIASIMEVKNKVSQLVRN